MRTLSRVASAALLLAACERSGPPAPAASAPVPAGKVVLATFTGEVNLVTRRMTIRRTAVASGSGKALVDIGEGGAADTVTVTTVGTPVTTDPDGCGAGVPGFTGAVEVRSYFATQALQNVYAEIQTLSPSGHEACNSAPAYGGLSTANGLFSYGTLAVAGNAADRATVTWAFSQPDLANFTFSGRIVADQVPQRRLAGVVTYDKVPGGPGGLAYASTAQSPVRGARLELQDAGTSAVVATTVTDDAGHYAFGWDTAGPNLVKVRIKALTATPVIRVQDNTSGGALWVCDSSSFDQNGGSTLDLDVPVVWNGTSYGGRAAAPFAVLDTAYSAARAFLAERPVPFPDLTINWSPDNRPESGDKTVGQIGTSHWDGTQLYILGKEDVDTDEYDAHIIAHEWGHYFESKLSRSDNPGGSHSGGDLKDPRLAWGEGWATGNSAVVLYPDVVYVDTMGSQQASAYTQDISNNDDGDPNPGWFSENSILHVFYDLWDSSGSEPFNTVQLPIGALYDAMVGDQKSTSAFTTLFSFVHALKVANPGQANAIDTLLANKGVADPIQDEWGTGETHTAGLTGTIPVYTNLTINGGPATVTFTSVDDAVKYNSLGSNRLLTFTGDGSSVTVSAATSGPPIVLIQLMEAGQGRGFTEPAAASGSVPLQTVNGAVYTIWFTANDVTPGNVFQANIQVTSP